MTSFSGAGVAMKCLVVVLLMCGSVDAQLRCYNCTLDTTILGDGGSCKVPKDGVTDTNNNCSTLCSTSSSPSANGGGIIYTRRCLPFQSTLGCNADECNCNTSLCNSNAFLALGTLKCYSCWSSYPIDNGCGEKFVHPDGGEDVYIKQLSGCTSCTKTVAPGQFGPSYRRDCARVVETSDSCGKSSTNGCSSSCKTDLCNSSTRLVLLGTATSLLTAVLVLVAGFCLQK